MLSLSDRCDHAYHLLSHGMASSALSEFRLLAKEDPRCCKALTGCGIALAEMQMPNKAIRYFRLAYHVSPEDPAVINNLANAYKGLELLEQAEDLYKRAIRSAPGFPLYVLNLTTLLLSAKRYREACHLLVKLTSQNPDIYDAWMQLGAIHLASKRHSEAISAFSNALQIKPNDPQSCIALARIRLLECEFSLAIPLAAKALSHDADNIEAINVLGLSYLKLGGIEQALVCYTRLCELILPSCIDLHASLAKELIASGRHDDVLREYALVVKRNPNSDQVWFELGSLYLMSKKLDEAADAFKQVLKLNPSSAPTHCNLALLSVSRGAFKEAFEGFDVAIQSDPGLPAPYINRGHLSRQLGDVDSAVQYYRRCLSVCPGFAEAHYSLSLCIDGNEDSLPLRDCEELLEQKPDLPSRICLEFAIAKYKSDRGDLECMKHYLRANALKFESLDWNRPDYEKVYRDSVRLSEALINKESRLSNFQPTALEHSSFSHRPIFIIGLPRSGSTLVETILSMNPHVLALGESDVLHRSIQKYADKLDKGASCRLEQIYFGLLEPVNPGLNHVEASVNKMLTNYVHAHLLLQVFESPRIIHVHRNIMDNVLSLLVNNFSDGCEWTFCLEEIYHYIIAYRSIIEDIDSRFPGEIFHCNYDELVSCPRKYIPRLTQFCGFSWDERFLDPHRSRRLVNTASALQVRKPINAKSVGGWKRYEDDLSPVANRLANAGFRF